MNKRLVLAGLLVLLMVSIAGYAAFSTGLIGGREAGISEGMPVPGTEGVEETVVSGEMPVPGSEGVDEMIVSGEMPVPGLEDIEETVVIEE